MTLSLEAAFDFLEESAGVPEDAGFKIIVPAWRTAKGQRRIKIRLRSTSSKKPSMAATREGQLSLENLIQYRYQFVIGEEIEALERFTDPVRLQRARSYSSDRRILAGW